MRDLNPLSRHAVSQHSTACCQKNLWTQKQWATKSLSPKKNVSKFIRGKRREVLKNQEKKESLLQKEAEKGTMSKKVQTRQIMRSRSKLQVAAKALKRELHYQDSVVEEDVVAAEAEAAEETTKEETEMIRENTMMTLMSNRANAQENN